MGCSSSVQCNYYHTEIINDCAQIRPCDIEDWENGSGELFGTRVEDPMSPLSRSFV